MHCASCTAFEKHEIRFTFLAQILHVNMVRGSNHDMDILRLKFILRGKLQPFGVRMGHGTRLTESNFSMPELPLLSHFCICFYHIIYSIRFIIKRICNFPPCF